MIVSEWNAARLDVQSGESDRTGCRGGRRVLCFNTIDGSVMDIF
jgi:hypothetical protein